jgi:hypothetical protein
LNDIVRSVGSDTIRNTFYHYVLNSRMYRQKQSLPISMEYEPIIYFDTDGAALCTGVEIGLCADFFSTDRNIDYV